MHPPHAHIHMNTDIVLFIVTSLSSAFRRLFVHLRAITSISSDTCPPHTISVIPCCCCPSRPQQVQDRTGEHRTEQKHNHEYIHDMRISRVHVD